MSLYPEHDVVEVFIATTIFKSKECLSVECPRGCLDSATGRHCVAPLILFRYIGRTVSIPVLMVDALVQFGQRVVVFFGGIITIVVAVIVVVWLIWCDEEHDVVASREIVGSFLVVVLTKKANLYEVP